MNRLLSTGLAAAIALALGACGEPEKAKPTLELPNKDPFPSTYQANAAGTLLIKGANLLIGNGEQAEATDLVVKDGKIVAVGEGLQVPDGATIVDGKGKWVTPGLIDVHSHMGVYPAPGTANHADGNEMTSPVTAQVWAEHSVWPEDPQFEKALAGGVTTVQILPGSGNLIGGRGVTLKNVPATTVQAMKFPGAPYSLKMACGENPKRFYGGKGQLPSTRMGNMAGYRSAWIEAAGYKKSWDDYIKKVEAGEEADAPTRDLRLETLVGVLEGDIRIHNHCYKVDEMAQMIDMAKEFGYKIAAFHHAIEGYKAAPMLAKEGICAVMWADWWGFKQEAFDMVRENIALVDYAKACAVIHSDDPIQVQRLNQEVAKAMSAGNRLGLGLTAGDAIKWATLNPAKSLGLEDQIGSLEAGKNADIVLWDANPMSVYAHAEKVWIDGVLRFDRNDASVAPTSDFNLGILEAGEVRP
ncbi:amidohydrolase [Simiduia aestuariiviva]|uniref:Imidazolonepropionase-like amidohydrolase n=1 Tax=Simiduia aestuariiviva TaxID=1510459 RepID=A0A839UP68_9GAMM|nr:amidohydrolase [Simiduia aestuariiviva]MBB3167185.1 imidazolonepropionase-like amidohydrolase [Simiduia aestuariiviva]